MAHRYAMAQRPSMRSAVIFAALLGAGAVVASACGTDDAGDGIASDPSVTSPISVRSSTIEGVESTSSTTVTTTTTSSTTTPEPTSSVTSAPTTTETTTEDAPAAPATTLPPLAATEDTVVAESTPSATLPPAGDIPPFSARIEAITDENADRLSESWRPGCPVGLDGLRLLTLSHWDFAGVATTGELVVAAQAAEDIVQVFETLFNARFPIERMELVDVYSGDDDLSMAANNTSAFNCREVAWKPGVWSNHAFGTAVDVNPLVNPYVSNTQVLPPEGAAFVERSTPTLGGLYPGDVATTAFADIGWIWGGTWSSAKDWQHFSASGG